MGKFRVITASPDHSITDGVTTHYFPTDFDRRAAQYFLDNGANFLYALAVDYPGLYKIPLCYREGARKELNRIGFKTYRPKWNGEFNSWQEREAHYPPYAQLFFLGPKEYRTSFGTNKANATSFKIWFGKVGGLF